MMIVVQLKKNHPQKKWNKNERIIVTLSIKELIKKMESSWREVNGQERKRTTESSVAKGTPDVNSKVHSK